jgi:hypothetical protein
MGTGSRGLACGLALIMGTLAFRGPAHAASPELPNADRLEPASPVRVPAMFSFDEVTPADALGRRFTFGYALTGQRNVVGVHAGHRQGVPVDELIPGGDDMLLLEAPLRLTAGTVATLQLAFDGFRELAGTRLVQQDPIPGLRVAFADDFPLEGAAGFVVLMTSNEQRTALVRNYAGLLQLCGRF